MDASEINSWVVVASGIAGIISTLAFVVFAYRKMVQAAAEKAEEYHNNMAAARASHRAAELEDQQKFRNDLMRQLADASERITDQSERLTAQDKHIFRLTAENDENRRHKEMCEKDLAWAKSKISALEQLSG